MPELFVRPDPDAMREYLRNKPRRMEPKVTPIRDAVARLVASGSYIGVGGFGTNRIPTAALHEILRQGITGLGLSGHTATHDFQILAAGEAIDRVDVAYVVGLEARGLSRSARRMFEGGRLRVTEWTNAALAWRYQAAAMGIPFLPARVMFGTDTLRYSAAKEITCPYTGTRLLALPALSPDVAIIHVHRADVYGNCQIDGISVSDGDLARAAKHVIITCERLVPTEEIRRDPTRTAIPYFLVDAVSEVPYGSYPGNMPYEYFSDEDHLRDWLAAEEDPATLREFLAKYIHGVADFNAYLQLCGGLGRLTQLRRQELMLDHELTPAPSGDGPRPSPGAASASAAGASGPAGAEGGDA